MSITYEEQRGILEELLTEETRKRDAYEKGTYRGTARAGIRIERGIGVIIEWLEHIKEKT